MIIMGGVKRIVAVDDSNVVLKMLQNVLDKEKYELHPFSTGTRALEYLVQKDKIPDLIILDIEMPEMNGYDVLERIKKMEHLEGVPVIFLTANNEKKQVIKAVTGGVKDYVVKPIDKDVLLKKLDALFKTQSGAGEEVDMEIDEEADMEVNEEADIEAGEETSMEAKEEADMEASEESGTEANEDANMEADEEARIEAGVEAGEE